MPFTHSRRMSLVFLLLVSLGLACRAGQDAETPSAGVPKAASAGESRAPNSQPDLADEASRMADAPRIRAGDVVALRRHVGQEVTAFGRIGRTARSRSGHRFLNFAGSELSAVCFPDDVKRFTEGDPATTYADRDVEIRGTLELYKGKLQIRLREPGQLSVVKDTPPSDAQRVTLRKTGRETWVSPAGLRYTGRDPAGRTRVEHVARHARDIPDRDGPHGVFDGGEEVAFAVIDEAWTIAQQRKLRPKREGDRSSYTVRMNRRIGYLGGRSGAQRNHPPLDRVFIVFETGTQNIITAFPK